MGYTHSWTQNGDQPLPEMAWRRICDDAQRLIAAFPHALVGNLSAPAPNNPIVSDSMIAFNGAPPGDCETFRLERHPASRRRRETDTPGHNLYAFCKTATLPYDRLVCAILAIAAEHAGRHLTVSSDGAITDDAWQSALAWASMTLNRTVRPPFTRRAPPIE